MSISKPLKLSLASLVLFIQSAAPLNAQSEIDPSNAHAFLGQLINGGMVMIATGAPPYQFVALHSYSSSRRCQSTWNAGGEVIAINWSSITSTDIFPLQNRPYMRINGSVTANGQPRNATAMVFHSDAMRGRARNAINDLIIACDTLGGTGY